MRLIGAGEVDRTLTFPRLVEALADAFGADLVAPERHHHALTGLGASGTLLLMPAWTGPAAAEPFLGVKVVSVFPENGSKSLPSVLGTYLLMDGATGLPLAALDGTRLTLWRTAAASALAARFLARVDASRMVMVGAGSLAPFLIRAHFAERPIRSVALWNRRPDRALALAAQLQAEGLPVAAVTDLRGAVEEADLVSCATLATAPIVKGAWLKPGAHLDLVGAFNLAMREADDAALSRASVFVDTPAALREGGDVALALASGAIGADHVRGTLQDLCRGRLPGRTRLDEITAFKSVGAAIEDLAAAMLVWQISNSAEEPLEAGADRGRSR